MKLSDIIKTESDRIFVINPECIIIFTGDTLEDSRPFIRLGNWLDLPVEIIPLIENIIVTDKLIGNPSHEQFNIDIKYLPTNRYIGSHLSLKKYLEYQKIYGLDLFNASIIDAERDIPELSKSKTISDRDSFIGIFYSDGNFIITHNKKNLFNLYEFVQDSHTDSKIHENISDNSKATKRYDESGFVLLDNNPIFYKNNHFISYMFPVTYYNTFNKLNINPKNIGAVIHPSSNFLSISRFLKWKNDFKNKIKIFSQFTDELNLIKNLFSDATINSDNFFGFSYDTTKGMIVENYNNSFNIKLTSKLKDSSKKELKVIYVKGASKLKNIINEKVDLILINYSVFEDTALLFKSCSTPFVILNDGSDNINKVSKLENIIIEPEYQYEFDYSEQDLFISKYNNTFKNLNCELICDSKLLNILEEKLSVENNSFNEWIDNFNYLSLIRYFHLSTANRKVSASLNNLIEIYSNKFSLNEINKNKKNNIKLKLCITQFGVFEIIEKIQTVNEHFFIPDDFVISSKKVPDKSINTLYNKILEDRERLMKLLSLYYQTDSAKKQIKELKHEIEKRKELYKKDQIVDEPVNKNILSDVLRKTPFGNLDSLDPSSPSSSSLDIKKFTRFLIIILILLLLPLAGYKGYNYYLKYKEEKAQQLLEQQKRLAQEEKKRIAQEKENRKKEIIKKYNIKISDMDILRFANKIAIKNGYAPISSKTIKSKNPDWIFPGNIFILPDNIKVIVKRGNTLWGIAYKKLIELNYNFYSTYDIIKEKMQKNETIETELLDKLTEFAETNDKKKLVKKLKIKLKIK